MLAFLSSPLHVPAADSPVGAPSGPLCLCSAVPSASLQLADARALLTTPPLDSARTDHPTTTTTTTNSTTITTTRAAEALMPAAAVETTAEALVGWAEAVRAAVESAGGDRQAEGRLLHLSHDAVRRSASVLGAFPQHYRMRSSSAADATAASTPSGDGPSTGNPVSSAAATSASGDASASASASAATPSAPLESLLRRAYPHRLMGLEPEEEAALAAAYSATGMQIGMQIGMQLSATETDRKQTPLASSQLPPPLPPPPPSATTASTASNACEDDFGDGEAARWIETAGLRAALRALSEDHAIGADVCIVGPAGGGKTALARRLAAERGYGAGRVRTVPLYRDMTSHELLQVALPRPLTPS